MGRNRGLESVVTKQSEAPSFRTLSDQEKRGIIGRIIFLRYTPRFWFVTVMSNKRKRPEAVFIQVEIPCEHPRENVRIEIRGKVVELFVPSNYPLLSTATVWQLVVDAAASANRNGWVIRNLNSTDVESLECTPKAGVEMRDGTENLAALCHRERYGDVGGSGYDSVGGNDPRGSN